MAEIRLKSTGTIKLFENDNTSNVTIASPASLGADRTITLPDASVTLASGTMLATDGSGASLTALNASELGSGTVPTARLGSGTASSSTVLYGDQTYKAEPGGGKLVQVVSGSLASDAATTSSSFSEVLEVNITPTVSGNYLLALLNCQYLMQGNGTTDDPNISFDLRAGAASDYAGATTYSQDYYPSLDVYNTVDSYIMVNGTMTAWFTLGTTSAQSVYFGFKCGAGRVGIDGNATGSVVDPCRLTILEYEV